MEERKREKARRKAQKITREGIERRKREAVRRKKKIENRIGKKIINEAMPKKKMIEINRETDQKTGKQQQGKRKEDKKAREMKRDSEINKTNSK